jgi:hypothetical protein
MRVGPSKPACRSRLQTTLSCAGKEPALRRSHGLGSWQVWIMETSTSEPLMRCRNKEDGVKTGVHSWSQDKHWGNLLTARAAPGIDPAFLVHTKVIPFKIKGKIQSKASREDNNDCLRETFLRAWGLP